MLKERSCLLHWLLFKYCVYISYIESDELMCVCIRQKYNNILNFIFLRSFK